MKRTLSPIWLSVNTIAAAAASAPPEETPTSAGSASGLRNSPCMIAPEAASSAPTIAAAAMRGIRIDHSTSWSRASVGAASPHSPSAAGSRASGMPAAPMVSAISAAPTSAISRQTRRGKREAERVSAARLRTRRAVGQGGHSRQLAVSGRGRELFGLRRQRRIELDREIAGGGRRARPEAEQIEAFHRDEGLVGGDRRQREGGMDVHRFRVHRILAALRSRAPRRVSPRRSTHR